ncbi:unnamed protein product, partial [Timema podura]|nr:unnamed protein product [Timema podura]
MSLQLPSSPLNHLVHAPKQACGIHFPTVNRLMNTEFPRSKEGRKAVAEVVQRICLKVEEMYGRLEPVMVEKATFDNEKDTLLKQIVTGKHIKETPEHTFVELVDKTIINQFVKLENVPIPEPIKEVHEIPRPVKQEPAIQKQPVIVIERQPVLNIKKQPIVKEQPKKVHPIKVELKSDAKNFKNTQPAIQNSPAGQPAQNSNRNVQSTGQPSPVGHANSSELDIDRRLLISEVISLFPRLGAIFAVVSHAMYSEKLDIFD